MEQFRKNTPRFGMRLFLVQEAMESIPQEVHADLRKFLLERRAYTNSWFLLLRVSIALGIIGCLAADAVMNGRGSVDAVLWVTGYVFANIGVHILSNFGIRIARWGYAIIDFLCILLLRHLFLFDAILDPNATMIGLFSLLLISYVHYSDVRLTSVMVVAVLMVTVLTLWMNILYEIPFESPLLTSLASYYAQPLPALLLLSFMGAVSITTHRLVHRLYAQLLRFSIEQNKRTKAAVSTAVERARAERLEELNKVKQDFITIISHELRNPITPLLSSLDILEFELSGESSPREMLSIARESAARIQRIVTDYTKLAELITLDDESLLRWNVRVDDLVKVLQEQTSMKPRFVGNLDDLVVCTDPRLFGGALLALLRRAEMLTPNEETITIRGYLDENEVVMSIHDPTSYLEEQTIAALDDPFVLTDERAFSTQPNTGLELILARHSMRRVGGFLQIDSVQDIGTTVHCTVPGQQPGTRWLSDSQLRQELSAIGV